MGNQTWLAEVLFAGLTVGEREHVLHLIGEATDAELRRLRSRGAGKTLEPRIDRARSPAEARVEGISQ
jgi:hypothetical protein